MQVHWSLSSPKFHNSFPIINILLLFTLFPLIQSPKACSYCALQHALCSKEIKLLPFSKYKCLPLFFSQCVFKNVLRCQNKGVLPAIYHTVETHCFLQESIYSPLGTPGAVPRDSHPSFPPKRIPAQSLPGADWLCILNVLPPLLHHSIRFLWGGITSRSYL